MGTDEFRVDLAAEIDRFFDPGSLSTGGTPRAVIIAGGTGAGKTRLRRERYGMGLVVLDAADIFLNLCRGRSLDFPGPLEEPLEFVGFGVARRIVREKRPFVTEIIGDEFEPTKALIESLRTAGYKVEFVGVECDVEVAWERNLNRGADNISAVYAQPFHYRWLNAALAGPK